MTTPKKPRVALFVRNCSPYSETFVYNQIGHHQRYEVEVFTNLRSNAEHFPISQPVHALWPKANPLEAWEALLYYTTTYSPTFYHRLREGQFSLIHAHFGPGSIYALPYRARLGLPLIVTFHGHDVPLLATARRFRPKHWPYWFLSKWMLRAVDRFLCVSEDLAEMLVRIGAPAGRVRVFNQGNPLPPFEKSEAEPGPVRIVMAGRFVEKKGFEYGFRAFSELLKSGIDAQLEVIGGGERERAYKRLVEALGIGDRVRFLGVLPHGETCRRIAGSDLMLAPSVVAGNGDREGIPNTVKEAACCAVPVVATFHGGIPQAVEHGRTGLLVPERSVAGLADGLRELAGRPELRREMGRAARAKMSREFNLDRQMGVLEKHFDEVVEESRLNRAA